MRKKYLSALLFGALLFASAGTFTSCKDYDDDINNLQEQINTINTTLSELKTLVGDGGVSSVTFDESTGVLTVVDANGTKAYTIKTAAGSVDEVKITIEGQELKVNGVTVGKVGDAVAVENGELTINGAATGIKVGEYSILDNQDAGTVTITLPDADGKMQTVVLMKAGSILTSIDVINAQPVENNNIIFYAYYDINKTDVEYGPNKKVLKAGLYTTLDRDLKIVANPRSVDVSKYTFSLKNSAGTDTELTFKTAVPYKGVLSVNDVTRTTSDNNIWVLENDYTRYDNNNLTDVRTRLYEKFKSNDGAAHALTLEASTGSDVYNTPYNLSAKLEDMPTTYADPQNMEYILIKTLTTPIVAYYKDAKGDDEGAESAVYDYWLTLEQSALNLQRAQLYGVEISEDGHTFQFTKEAGIGNEIKFVYNYILLNGTIVEGDKAPTFTARFSQETATTENKAFEDLIKPFDATLVDGENYKLFTDKCSSEDKDDKGAKAFGMTETYDFNKIYNELSDDNKLVWNSAIEEGSVSFELFGGEGGNNADKLNKELLKNIRYEIDNTKKEIKLQFLVDKDRCNNNGIGNNFALNNAYELVMTVKDPIANNIVLTLKFPFELQQPTMDIVARDGKFSQWKTVGDDKEEYLYSYGAYGDSNTDMYLPLYESFKAWTKDYTDWDENAQFYNLTKLTDDNNASSLLGEEATGVPTVFNDGNDADKNGLEYTTEWANWNTYTKDAKAGTNNAEKTIVVKTSYKHYGVYEEKLFTGGKTDNKFVLVFASLLKNSSLKMAEGSETLIANAGTNDVFISNDILNLTTPMGEKFYLFDGLNSGTVVNRKDLNKESFNEEQRPFLTVDQLFKKGNNNVSVYVSARDKNAPEGATPTYKVVVGAFDGNDAKYWNIDAITGKRSYVLDGPDNDNIVIYNIPAYKAVQDGNHTWSAADVVSGHTGGMAIQLPTSIADKEEIEFTITVEDGLGFTNDLKFTVKKIQ